MAWAPIKSPLIALILSKILSIYSVQSHAPSPPTPFKIINSFELQIIRKNFLLGAVLLAGVGGSTQKVFWVLSKRGEIIESITETGSEDTESKHLTITWSFNRLWPTWSFIASLTESRFFQNRETAFPKDF